MKKSKLLNIFFSILLLLGIVTPLSLALQANSFALRDDTPVGDGVDPTAEAAVSGTAEDVCKGIKATGGDCEVSEDDTTVGDIIALVINILSILVGVAAVIMIIVNGFRFVISNGDSTAVGAAKNGIIYAIIGLVIVAMAQVIVVFVINRANSAGDTPKSALPGPKT